MQSQMMFEILKKIGRKIRVNRIVKDSGVVR
jgi:hypothetical protein